MSGQALREARKYEELSADRIRQEERPAFHLSARTGWMNDPNGFSWYNGEYHLFYQYHPYDCNWGPMHWGHAVSKDLLHWDYLPAAMAPEESYDKDGCFSGSAVQLADGRQLLIYTGMTKEYGPNGSTSDIQTQCLAVGNGRDYEKYGRNPVIDEKALPEGGSRCDFRDPKIWRKEDGTYRCVVGNMSEEGSGQILLYASPDGFHWNFEKVLIENRDRYGKMWECPDFFPLGDKWVLLTSPQDMLPQGLEYHSGNGTLCLIGEFDEKEETFTQEKDQAVDYGIDFYAPQTMQAPDGRRIMIGWMQNWDTCSFRGEKQLWFGQMSLPRELTIRNGRLYQNPVKELETLRRNPVEHRNVPVSGMTTLEGIRGRRIDLELTVKAADSGDIYQEFALGFAQDDTQRTELSFRPGESLLKMDRSFSGTRKAVIHQCGCLVNSRAGELKLRLILDRFSAEVFVNDGEQAMTVTFYTPQEADGISFFADGRAFVDVMKYDLEG